MNRKIIQQITLPALEMYTNLQAKWKKEHVTPPGAVHEYWPTPEEDLLDIMGGESRRRFGTPGTLATRICWPLHHVELFCISERETGILKQLICTKSEIDPRIADAFGVEGWPEDVASKTTGRSFTIYQTGDNPQPPPPVGGRF